jgi:hypothetical protein
MGIGHRHIPPGYHFVAVGALAFPDGGKVHSLVPVQAVKPSWSNHNRPFRLQSLDTLERTQNR